MELCLKHARNRHRRSVDRVADLMGLANKWNLYKWMESGRLPAVLIPAFEHACGAHYVSEYLAYAAQRLAIEIPQGRTDDESVAALQGMFADAVSLLVRFYRDEADADHTIAQLHRVLSATAWHRENIIKRIEPELDLFASDEEIDDA